ncbi:glycoside hydrolase family 2 protein [Sunxiuqinia sp. A32]|uniref:glycoside hydrolase family 2 protein n=1 Tax=Sunxiuqinia sp. A32 TaxID=3461496 RepID=UPI004045E9B2
MKSILSRIAIGSFVLIFCFGCSQSAFALTVHDTSSLDWKLWGYRPNVWRMNFNFDSLSGTWAEIQGIDATVPGSVRNALKDAGIIPDWNVGLNYTASEWVENRHWLFCAKIPDEWVPENKENVAVQCLGLDYKGYLMLNGKEVGYFNNAFIPYNFNIGEFLKETNNTLVFVFECPPENLAQIGWTSKIKDWKPRFNYGWDWVPRIVQTGIWDKVQLVVNTEQNAIIEDVRLVAEADRDTDSGDLKINLSFNKLPLKSKVKISLAMQDGEVVKEETITATQSVQNINWSQLKIIRWYPNGSGEQPLYHLNISLLGETGKVVQQVNRNIGFRHIEWQPCEGAVPHAEPWLCSINGHPVFLQGVNWTPIRPNFADLKEEDYRKLLSIYKDLGLNIIRVWGGGFPEKEWLYDICDEMGILIWQDFPLSSSGLDNYPPEGAEEIYTMSKILNHYVSRLHHHASLLLWCAGNELYEKGDIAPVDDQHPLINAMKKQIVALDPTRKFVPGCPSGPNIYADWSNFGSGDNWDVHGPWKMPFRDENQNMDDVHEFWEQNDALFHSEAGVPGAMSAEMIRKYAGDYAPLPADFSNPLWRTVNWWTDWKQYHKFRDKQVPESLENYVEWSQQRQTEGLSIALDNSKKRFPKCGGFIIWMGHDCYPCPINTSIIDFEGNLKPSALEISKIWRKD